MSKIPNSVVSEILTDKGRAVRNKVNKTEFSGAAVENGDPTAGNRTHTNTKCTNKEYSGQPKLHICLC